MNAEAMGSYFLTQCFLNVVFKLLLQINVMGISGRIALVWMPQKT